ncbi:uncharacterized protein FFFS_04370 [Fusarium fujikuroi]|nr:uncharacterized protein FFFS_04370 [Fusarium fujikuroi]
MPYISAFL